MHRCPSFSFRSFCEVKEAREREREVSKEGRGCGEKEGRERGTEIG